MNGTVATLQARLEANTDDFDKRMRASESRLEALLPYLESVVRLKV